MKARVIELFRAGHEPHHIAKSLNISTRQVYRHLDGLDLDLIRKTRKSSGVEQAAIKTLFDCSVYNRTELSQRLGVSYQYVWQVTQ